MNETMVLNTVLLFIFPKSFTGAINPKIFSSHLKFLAKQRRRLHLKTSVRLNCLVFSQSAERYNT